MSQDDIGTLDFPAFPLQSFLNGPLIGLKKAWISLGKSTDGEK
jgi:hypothetical protein